MQNRGDIRNRVNYGAIWRHRRREPVAIRLNDERIINAVVSNLQEAINNRGDFNFIESLLRIEHSVPIGRTDRSGVRIDSTFHSLRLPRLRGVTRHLYRLISAALQRCVYI